MSDINLARPHSLSIAKAKALVQRAADGLATEYDLKSEWHGNTLRFQRSGVDGQMLVTDSAIELSVTLGLLMKPFKGKFVDRIGRDLDKLLAEAEPGAQAKGQAKKRARNG
jgi:putative polyhydroxyalkanoate system protein